MNQLEEHRAFMERILLERRTVHQFADEPIPEELLVQALRTAIAAPNHRMTEPWRFVIVGDRTRQRLADIAVAVKAKRGPLPPRAEADVRAKVLSPPVLLVVSRVRHEKPDVEREDYAAIACALQNLMLFFGMHDIGSKWSSGAVTHAPDTYAALGVDEAEQEIVGFLWIGRASGEQKKPRRERGVEDILRRVP